jgi:hypothetical protein
MIFSCQIIKELATIKRARIYFSLNYMSYYTPFNIIKNQSFFLFHKTSVDSVFREFPELKPPKGKFRIIGIEKFEIPGEGHWVVEDLDNMEEAIKKATEMTKNASKDAAHPSVATVFYVYDENGEYLGGDIHSR